MLGTKLRSWMEAHIVRSRKKTQRTKEAKSVCPKDLQQNSPHESSNGDFEFTKSKSGSVRGERTDGVGMSEAPTLNNLSSPESAYSTGYSTDGTSPGASFPPEYYINPRTGKHYVEATTGNATVTQGPGPASPHRKRKPKPHDGFPESSTEEDLVDRSNKSLPPHTILSPKEQRKAYPVQNVNSGFHRRTESCDESQQRLCLPLGSERGDSEGSSSTGQTGSSAPSGSPYLSSASPRQRNRIRTNPWLAQSGAARGYNSQAETSSTVGSSSTLSSTGCKERVPREGYSPKPQNKQLEDIKNYNVFRNPTFNSSPLVGVRKPLGTVTTCSPLPNRPCRHFRPETSSSSSSSPSSGSDDNHHGNTSDFSDDDVTLNEMLGKYDESYVYEKETDILSDSDPTDCEDQHDYNDNTSHLPEEQQTGSEMDFIDNGSLLELANSDSEHNGKLRNRGHCTYHSASGHTPDACRRHCSRMRRGHGGDGSGGSSRASSISNKRFRRRNSRRDEISASADVLTKQISSRKKLRLSSRERKCSTENVSKEYNKNSQMMLMKNVSLRGDQDTRALEQFKHVNLNRVLMERLIHNQRSGTRSADGTPISLRKNGTHDYNGKYLRNPHVSKLINSNSNLVERRSKAEGADGKNVSTALKKRSNSLSGYSSDNPPALPPRNPLNQGKHPSDKEGDMRYRKLIQEAETILEGYTVTKASREEYLSPTLSTRSANIPLRSTSLASRQCNIYENQCDMNSQLSMLEEKINNNPIPVKTDHEEGIFKAISKTLEKIIIRSSESKKTEKGNEITKSKKRNVAPVIDESAPPDNSASLLSNQINANLRHSSEVLTTTDKNDNMFPPCYTPVRLKIHNRNKRTDNFQTFCKTECVRNFETFEIERFRPVNKGVDIIRGTDPLYSPLNMSPRKINNLQGTQYRSLKSWQDNKNESYLEVTYLHQAKGKTQTLDGSDIPEATLVPFKSFDLGNQSTVSSRYCPQSEPVKRKVYVGSSTFGKLQKSLMRKPPHKNHSSEITTEDLRDENESLKGKVAQLRRERLQVEARVRETQEQIDRLKFPEAASRC